MARLESRLALFCRALWLVQGTLTDVRTGGPDRGDDLVLGLGLLGFRDDAAATAAVRSFLSSKEPLRNVIEALADSLFVPERGHPVLRQGIGTADLRRLIRLADSDALACLWPKLQPGAKDGFDWPVVPMDDGGAISALLRKGSIETHIHLGGAMPPVFYWVLLMGGELNLDRAGEIRSGLRGHAPKEAWSSALYGAVWNRYQLAAKVEELAARAGEPPVFPHLAAPDCWDAFSDKDPPNSFEIRERVAKLARSGTFPSLDRNGPPVCSEPLRHSGSAGVAGAGHHYASGERRLLFHLGRFLARPKLFRSSMNESAGLEAKLLAYLRVRNAFHQLMAHDYGTDGLFRFTETFRRRALGQEVPRKGRSARGRRLRRGVLKFERVRMAAALDCQLLDPFDISERTGSAVPTRRIEMRVSVPEGPYARRTLRSWMEGIADHLRSARSGGQFPGSHVGLLFHVLKKENKTKEIAARDATRLRFFLEGHPHFCPFVVGFDGAGKERAAPPRDFLKAFHDLKQLVRRHRPGPGLPPVRLGFTFHVGEDVADLLTGLRHLDEAVSLLLPRFEGGRLGHALALGDDPDRFYGNRGFQTEPRLGAHLLDLVWAWGRLSETDESKGCQSLQTRISRLSGHSIEETKIARCYEEMGLDAEEPEPEEGSALNLCFPSDEDLTAILGIKADLSKPVVVQADAAWRNRIRELQVLLQKRIALRPVCIEANPTSNLIIGGFIDYSQLPYARLVEAGLPVSINTDDPGLFMTSLPGELAALYSTWEGKKPHREILAWLSDRLIDAERSTFLRAQHHPSAHGWEEADIDRIFREVREG
jgi:adenosine deaminase